GELRIHPLTSRDEHAELQRVLHKSRQEGFKEIADEEQSTLLVEYSISGMGTTVDLDKRIAWRIG
ncbi:MAG TPA: hypothetical protein VE783_00875, partial [Candidatus Limnocylindrales bacterium]|nr:hypothetical protein [Candidatus Limnocylindrales bacterium]